jgi:hypothetical protein
VDDKKVMTDGNHVIELYHQQNFSHNDGMLLVYLPKEKMLLEADGFNPPAQTLTRTPESINPQSVNLEANIERLKLVMKKELFIAIGKGNKCTRIFCNDARSAIARHNTVRAMSPASAVSRP